jgi:hypothetical protein
MTGEVELLRSSRFQLNGGPGWNYAALVYN